MTTPLDAPVTRSFVFTVLCYLGTIAFVVGGGILTASRWRIDETGTILIFGGVALFAATLIRPSFFWNHWKVRLIRSTFGDRGAMAFYFLFSAGFTLFGVNRIVYRNDATAECARMAASAPDSRKRVDVLHLRPDVAFRGLLGMVGKPNPMTCGAYLDNSVF